MARVRSWWGWGFEDAEVDPSSVAPLLEGMLGFGPTRDTPLDPLPAGAITLREPRVEVPAGAMWSTDPMARLQRAHGKAFRDIARALAGRIDNAPDVVAFARDEDDVAEVLAWASAEGVAVVPYGGGTSVVGGVEPRFGAPAVSLDLGALDRVLEIDDVSRLARIQGGAPGPVLEAQLAERGMTMRFFPQSSSSRRSGAGS